MSSNDDGAHGADRPPEQIEADIEKTRADLGQTIDAIERRLSPERIKEEAQSRAREATIGRLQRAGDVAREQAIRALDAGRDATRRMTMPRLSLGGHPLHPQLIGMPAALLPFSLVLDILHRSTGKRAFAEASYYTMMGGFVGGAAAAAAGAPDYLSIPTGDVAKRAANVHGAMNLGLLGMTGVNLRLRSRKRRSVGTLPLTLSAIGVTGLMISAWFGQHMVYDLGVRVRDVGPEKDAPVWGPPGDEQVHHSLESVAQQMPATGPTLQAAPSGDGASAHLSAGQPV